MPPTDDQPAFDAAYRYVYAQMAAGASDDRIRDALSAGGWDPGLASVVVAGARGRVASLSGSPAAAVAAPPVPAAVAAAADPLPDAGAGRDMWVGGLVCAIGIVITLVTYAAAGSRQGGGRYIIAWGAIAFGALQFLKGLFRLGAGR